MSKKPKRADGGLHQEYLTFLAYQGLLRRFESLEGDPRDRVDTELEVIGRAGFASYFLIVHDIVSFCRREGVPVGPGRGSVCGSMVAYVIGITDVDPLVHRIPFSRFLHLERVAFPDVDLDVCQTRRQEVIEYTRQRYGSDSVASIMTFGTLMAKQVILDVCRVWHVNEVLGYHPGNTKGEELAALVPAGSGADQARLAEFVQTPDGARLKNELGSIHITHGGRSVDLLDICLRLEGLRRHGSVHAAGIVIGDRALADIVPLYKRNQEAEVQTQYDYLDAEAAGLLKLDILGLRTVTVLGELEWLTGVRCSDIPTDDRSTFDLLGDGRTVGVFQLEGSGITDVCRKMKPDRFEDVIALIALYRPGPMEQIDEYVGRKHGRRPVIYRHPSFERVLGRTYGLIVYQEQVMELSQELAGFTPGEADLFRKAIGKKDLRLLQEQLGVFRERATARGEDPELLDRLIETMVHHGRYSFNLGHATGYGYITYWTAWFKANYPTEFYVATMNSFVGTLDRIQGLVHDAGAVDVSFLPPDYNDSGREFTVAGDRKVRFGLGAVKGLGESMVRDILEERDGPEKTIYSYEREERTRPDGDTYRANVRKAERVPHEGAPFSSVSDFCRRLTHIPINAKRALAIAGAFGLEGRARLYAALKDINAKAKRDRDLAVADWSGDEEVPSDLEMLRLERDTLGMYVSQHPLDSRADDLALYGAAVSGSFDDLRGPLAIGGLVSGIRQVTTRRGDGMAFLSLETRVEGLPSEITVFPDVWSSVKVRKDDMVIVRGKRQEHKTYGSGIIATSIQVLHESRLVASKLHVSLGEGAEYVDVDDLWRFLFPSGASDGGKTRVQVAVWDGGRVALLALGRQVLLTREMVDSMRAAGWSVLLDPGSDLPGIGGRSSTVFRGQSREPVWELPFVSFAARALDAKVVAEMEKPA